MRILAIFFLSTLLSLSLAITLEKDASKNEKVRIDIYYQSLCFHCQHFIKTQIKAAASIKDFWKICEITLNPFGKAVKVSNGSHWEFTCQNGARQCQGNMIETCVLKLYSRQYYTKSIPFIVCFEQNSEDWIAQGKACAAQQGLNWTKIQHCYTTDQGNTWLAEFAGKGEMLQPHHTHLPWIVVNGVHSQAVQFQVRSNIVKYVCQNYKGFEKISACQK